MQQPARYTPGYESGSGVVVTAPVLCIGVSLAVEATASQALW